MWRFVQTEDSPKPPKIIVDRDGAQVVLIENFTSKKETDALLSEMKADLPSFKPDEYFIQGKLVPSPRIIKLYGDPKQDLNYKGQNHRATQWLPSLLSLRSRLEKLTDQQFSSALINYYRNGNDYISFHKDKAQYVVYETTIASLSLGATREFILKHETTGQKTTVLLHHRALLLMRGKTNSLYFHAIKKDPKILEPRFNITFRLEPHVSPLKRKHGTNEDEETPTQEKQTEVESPVLKKQKRDETVCKMQNK